MDFYEQLQNIDEKNLDSFVSKRIDDLEENLDDDVILGFHVDSDMKNFLEDDGDKFYVDVRCYHKGYIKKGTKMVYGIEYNADGDIGNNGNYYYMDDDSYLYDFCRYIKDEDVYDEIDLFDHIEYFLKNHFGTIKTKERGDMFSLLMNTDGKYITPVNEHGISWFKGSGNAMCSEYATMAQNIMSLFGIDSYLIIGRVETGINNGESHAFNLVSLSDDDNLLVDFADHVVVYDIDYSKMGDSPFIGVIDKLDDQFILDLVYNGKELEFEDYNYFYVGEQLCQIAYNRNRKYYVEDSLIPDYKVAKK